MKGKPPPIALAKQPNVPPEPELTGQEARSIVRIFMIMLGIILLSEVAGVFTPSGANPAAAVVRSGMQWLLTWSLNEGNHAVHSGSAGWLFEQREIDRLTQSGDRDDGLRSRLKELAARLKAEEKSLIVVAIPGRVTLYPEQVRSGRYAGPVRAKAELEKLAELTAVGIDVMDMTDALWEFREKQQVFFAQDSHWTPEAMKAVAMAVNKRVRERFPRLVSNETPIITATLTDHSDVGDLARHLDPFNVGGWLEEEIAELISISGIDPDPKGPVVLHGGSLMRVFDDSGGSFGGGGKPPRAGFATQLATLLGRPIDVRDMPADDDSYEDKKLVICLLPMTELVP